MEMQRNGIIIKTCQFLLKIWALFFLCFITLTIDRKYCNKILNNTIPVYKSHLSAKWRKNTRFYLRKLNKNTEHVGRYTGMVRDRYLTYSFFVMNNHQWYTEDRISHPKAAHRYIWATLWQNLFYAICEQQRRRSACASAQSDQRLCCSLPG